MAYLVLARKYRPGSFEDLVGQGHVAQILRNAIATGRIAHAFLFTGVRGVGKTTSARLLAKCLNCVGADGKQEGPTATPCQVCGPCTEITAGRDLDVQEIDGASYNGVDEVRRLQESLVFRPARDRYKIFIVDEVHMLSNAAWNAFLKTLEEPPPHVKFIFATTEVQKVPATILSRCQRYDFKLIDSKTISARLRQVLSAESLSADDAAISLIAREAAGSMRDAMSLLDQAIAYCSGPLTHEEVARGLGVAERSVVHRLAAAVVNGSPQAALDVVSELAESGFDLPHLAKDLLEHLRDLVVAKVASDAAPPGEAVAHLRERTEAPDEELSETLELARSTNLDDLCRLFQGYSQSYDEVLRSPNVRISLEMLLVRLAHRPALIPLSQLFERLDALGAPKAGTPRNPPSGSRGAAPQERKASPYDARPSSQPNPAAGPPPAATQQNPARTQPIAETPSSARTRGSLALAEPSPALTPPQRIPNEASAEPLRLWRDILSRLGADHPSHAAVFQHAYPFELNRERALLNFPPGSFLGARATEGDALSTLTRVVQAYFGHPTRVVVELSERARPQLSTVAEMDGAERERDLEKARANVRENPVVRDTLRLFEGELLDIRLAAAPASPTTIDEGERDR